MKCVKTGLTFQFKNAEFTTYHCDMFYNHDADIFIIRGFAKNITNQKPDIIIERIFDCFKVISMSDEIKTHFDECVTNTPKLIDKLIFVDDPRFF